MNRKKVSVILPFIAWFALFPLLWLTSRARGITSYFSASLIPIYMIVVPMTIVRFAEKQSITERFGLRSARFLILVFLVLTSIAATIIMTAADWNASYAVLLAPIPEEVFFRGYFLGRFTNGNTSKSTKAAVMALLLSSVVFSLSHIFRPYSVPNYLSLFEFGVVTGFTYLLSDSILLGVAIHTAWNFSLTVKPVYLFSTQFFSWAILITAPSCLLFAEELLKRRRLKKIKMNEAV